MPDLLYLMGFTGNTPPLGEIKAINFEEDLHLTILPAFVLSKNNLSIFRRTAVELVKWFPPVEIVPVRKTVLGTIEKIPAMIVDSSNREPYTVLNLHKTFCGAVRDLGGRFFQENFVNNNFIPHVSHWAGDGELRPEALSLIWHSEGFCRGVVNLANYHLNDSIKEL